DRATGPLTLDGPAFRLASVLRRAAVYRDADLLAPLRASGDAWAGSTERTLPVPSSPYARALRVWAHSEDGDEVTVTAYSFDDNQLGQAVSGDPNEDGSTTAALALPVGTWYVTVATDGASWPSLYTRAPAPVEVVVPTPGACVPPGTPANLAGTPGTGEVEWTWDAVAGADGYTLRIGEVEGGPYDLVVELALADLGDPDNPSYTQTGADGGTTYYAVVSAWEEI